ncbi:hypothetical protein BDF19DRAFT_419424 [Syncephalis fuscata]|nr:hypothetical protein BDF19DRAFT_419424 [Syncephalis fuscata]
MWLQSGTYGARLLTSIATRASRSLTTSTRWATASTEYQKRDSQSKGVDRSPSFRLAQQGKFITNDALIADIEALEEYGARAADAHRAPPELWASTEPRTPDHELPRHAAINRLLYNLRTGADCELFVPIISRWRRTPLLLTARSTTVAIRNLIRFNRPDLCLTMLADRNRYGPIVYEGDFLMIMESFERQAIEAAEKNEQEAAELALDRMYATFGLAPYYDVAWTSAMYARLVHAGLEVNIKQAWPRAVETAEELWEMNGMNYEIADLIQHGFLAREDTVRAEEWARLRDTFPKPEPMSQQQQQQQQQQ